MKIGMIGSGAVAQTLGAGFLKHGHDVELGTREPAKLKDWGAKNSGARTGSFAEAARFGEVVVLAVGGMVAMEALQLAGAENLAGKTVIDACNPIGGAPPVNGVLAFFTSLRDSLMERLQAAFPSAHFVKAFNSVGSAQMVNPKFAGGRPRCSFAATMSKQRRLSKSCLISSVGTRRTWAPLKRRGRSSRCACSGAFPA